MITVRLCYGTLQSSLNKTVVPCNISKLLPRTFGLPTLLDCQNYLICVPKAIFVLLLIF